MINVVINIILLLYKSSLSTIEIITTMTFVHKLCDDSHTYSTWIQSAKENTRKYILIL